MLKVREGKPSKACREDDERFCLCGKEVGEDTDTKDEVSEKGGEEIKTRQASEWR